MLLVIVAVISGCGGGERNGGIMLMEMVEVMFILVLMVLVVSCNTYYEHTRHKRYDVGTHKDTLVTAQTYRSCHISKT